MSERTQQRTFLHREARTALDRSRGKDNSSVDKDVDTDRVTEASIQAALTPDIAKSTLFSNPDNIACLAGIASSDYGLGSADIAQVMQEVQRHLAIEADATVRAQYSENMTNATHEHEVVTQDEIVSGGNTIQVPVLDASGKPVMQLKRDAHGDPIKANPLSWRWGTMISHRWKESIAVVGLGQASDVRKQKADIVRDRTYMEEMIVSAMERQASRKNLEVYSQLAQTGVSNSVETIKSRLRMGEVTAEDVIQSVEYTQTIERIVSQFQIQDTFELEPGNEINATEPAVKEAIKNHLGFLMKSELIHLIQAGELEVLTSDQYQDEGGSLKNNLKKISTRLGTSGTLWTVGLKTGGRLAIGGAVGASVLSGGSGLAIAAVLGGASGLLRERLNRAERIKQRQIDVALGSSLEGSLPSSSVLAENMFNKQVSLALSVRRDTPEQVHSRILELHGTIADVQACLALSMQPDNMPGKVKQDLIVFGGRNRFKAQQELLDNLANALDGIQQAVDTHPERDAIREEMKTIAKSIFEDVQQQAEQLQTSIREAEGGKGKVTRRDVRAFAVGAGFAGFASAAMDLMHYVSGMESVSPAATLREGKPGVFTFNYQGDEHHGIVSSDGNVHLTELDKDFQLPEGIDPKSIHIRSMNYDIGDDGTGDNSIGIYDVTSGEPVAQIEIEEYTTTEGRVLKETTEVANLTSGQRGTYAFTGQDGTNYRVTLDNTGKATLVRDTNAGWMKASDDISLLADDVVGQEDLLKQATRFHITETGDGVIEIRSIYNPDEVVASIKAPEVSRGMADVVSQPATLEHIAHKAGDVHSTFAMEELSGWESEVLEHRYDELSSDYWPLKLPDSVASAAIAEPMLLPSDQSRSDTSFGDESSFPGGQPISAIGETVPHERLIEREADRIASQEKRRTMKQELIAKQTEFQTKLDAINQAITTSVTELTAKRGDAVAVADIEALATQREKFDELKNLGIEIEDFLFTSETVGRTAISFDEIDQDEQAGSLRTLYKDNMDYSVIISKEAPFDDMIVERIMVTLNSARGAMEVALKDDAMTTASKLAKLRTPLVNLKAIVVKFNEKLSNPASYSANRTIETAVRTLEQDVAMAEQFINFKANFSNPAEVWGLMVAVLVKNGVLAKTTNASPFKLKYQSDTIEVANAAQFATLLAQFKTKGEGKVGLKAVGLLGKMNDLDPKTAIPLIVQIIQRLKAGEADIFAVPAPPTP